MSAIPPQLLARLPTSASSLKYSASSQRLRDSSTGKQYIAKLGSGVEIVKMQAEVEALRVLRSNMRNEDKGFIPEVLVWEMFEEEGMNKGCMICGML